LGFAIIQAGENVVCPEEQVLGWLKKRKQIGECDYLQKKKRIKSTNI